MTISPSLSVANIFRTSHALLSALSLSVVRGQVLFGGAPIVDAELKRFPSVFQVKSLVLD